MQSSWATVRIAGTLCQSHRTLLDYLFGASLRRRANDDASLDVLFSPHAVLRLLGHCRPGKSDYTWLLSLIEDLRVAAVQITTRKGDCISMVTEGIITRYGYVVRGSFAHAEFGVRISPSYMRIYSRDMPCHSERLTRQIAAIPSGAAQAIARFALSHELGYSGGLSVVLQAVGIDAKDAKKRARQDLERYADQLGDLGIAYHRTTDVVTATRVQTVWFGSSPRALPASKRMCKWRSIP